MAVRLRPAAYVATSIALLGPIIDVDCYRAIIAHISLEPPYPGVK